MIVWWNTTSEWVPVARLAKNCLLWHYISFLCLFFFKGKEKLKSPLRIGRWMYLHKGGERRVWDCLRFPGKRNSDCSRITKRVSCIFPASLGGMPDQHRHPSQHPKQASLPGLTQSFRVSWRELFWVRSILACLPVCTTECCQTGEGWDLRLPVPDTIKRRSFPLSDDSLSHRHLH